MWGVSCHAGGNEGTPGLHYVFVVLVLDWCRWVLVLLLVCGCGLEFVLGVG